MTDQDRLLQVFAYMNMGNRTASHPDILPTNGAFVFCREDPEMADAAAELFHRGLVGWILLTGGIGKDSGPRSRAAGSEAAHQKRLLVETHNVPEGAISIETQASNGAENSRFGIGTIVAQALPHTQVILVTPSRYARRLHAVHTLTARQVGFDATYQVVCMRDTFDPDNLAHRDEVLREFLRVADWPAKGWSDPQPDLPGDLVAWAHTVVP